MVFSARSLIKPLVWIGVPGGVALLFLGAINLLKDPPAVQDGYIRKKAFLKGEITEAEWRNPALLAARRAREDQALESQSEKAKAWDDIREKAGAAEKLRMDQEAGLPSRAHRNANDQAAAAALLDLARSAFGEGDLDSASRSARKALNLLTSLPEAGAALVLSGEIAVESGDIDTARAYFLRAAELDPTGTAPEHHGGGGDKFLWLAQLSEEGGEDSVGWFNRGCEVLRTEIASNNPNASSTSPADQDEGEDDPRRNKLASALCSLAEIYMTDLSFQPDAESHCERFIAEAMLISPQNPEIHQTLANIRISQERIPEAQAALLHSLTLWQHHTPSVDDGDAQSEERRMNGEEDAGGDIDAVPPFPTRISLARLLIECSLTSHALEVLDRLIQEDDQSVEAWYLGGWSLYLLATDTASNPSTELPQQQSNPKEADGADSAEQAAQARRASRRWLRQSLTLAERLEYEDERLVAHARELVLRLDEEIGDDGEDEEEEGEEEWAGLESEDEGESDGLGGVNRTGVKERAGTTDVEMSGI